MLSFVTHRSRDCPLAHLLVSGVPASRPDRPADARSAPQGAAISSLIPSVSCPAMLFAVCARCGEDGAVDGPPSIGQGGHRFRPRDELRALD
jgi:hypothetical protein